MRSLLFPLFVSSSLPPLTAEAQTGVITAHAPET